MKILITGGKGFLGSNIAHKVMSMGGEVLIISRDNINPKNQIIEFNPDVVIHCAWKGGNNYNDINNLSQFDNVSQGIELIEIISKLPTKTKFIGFGSFAEYGTLNSPALETDKEQPINLYGLSKYTFKNYSKMLCDEYNIEWGWIRPCYVYGPGDVNTRLIPTIINKLLKNEEVELDACNKTIDYIYIDDFVNFVYSLIVEKIDGVYNICSGQQYNLKDIIKKIGLLMGKLGNIKFDNSSTRKLTSSIICGNNNKIKQQSQIETLIDINEGLLKTINYYKSI
jgi:nucleoside-diphosphate-sugar epimerase